MPERRVQGPQARASEARRALVPTMASRRLSPKQRAQSGVRVLVLPAPGTGLALELRLVSPLVQTRRDRATNSS